MRLSVLGPHKHWFLESEQDYYWNLNLGYSWAILVQTINVGKSIFLTKKNVGNLLDVPLQEVLCVCWVVFSDKDEWVEKRMLRQAL